jgi:HSP20 family protein
MTLMNRNTYDPFYDLSQATDRMYRMLNGSLALFNDHLIQSQDVNTLAVDMTNDDNELVVRTAVPGFKEDEVKIDVRGNILTIAAETQKDREDQQANWHIREMSYGKFARSLVLPEEVITDKAEASLENGVLTVKLPKQKSSPIQRIAVKARNLLKARNKKDRA